MGMSGDKLDEAVEKATESLKAQYMPSIGDFFKNLVIAILVGFVLSLIFAAIFKKNPPMFAPVEEEN
jgi:cell division protein FtsN